MITYEQRLNSNPRWALMEGSLHFERDSEVQKSLSKACQRFDELGIPYAIIGAMALFFYGYRRFTENIDFLVTRSDRDRLCESLDGHGYAASSDSKSIRDEESGVHLRFRIAGDYPGDGKPKPIAFPEPEDVTLIDGMRCLALPRLVEVKLASGMSHRSRIRDLADVQDLIQRAGIPRRMAQELHPWVQEQFNEAWALAHTYYSELDWEQDPR